MGDGPIWKNSLPDIEAGALQSTSDRCVYQPGKQGADACTEIIQSGVPDEGLGWAYFDRALHFSQMGDYRSAVADFTKGLSIKPDDAEALYWRANSNYELGNTPATISDLNAAIQLDATKAEFFILRGRALRSLQQYNLAIENFNQAQTLDPHDDAALRERGLTRYDEGDYMAAKKDLDAALMIAPSITGFEFRGNVYYRLGQIDLAIKDYSDAIKLDPNFVSAFLRRGAAEIRIKDYQDAVRDLTEYVAEYPQSSGALVDRAMAFKGINKLDDALQDLNAAIKIAPHDPVALAERGSVFTKLGRYSEALDDLNASLRLKSNDPFSLQARGLLYLQMENFDSALRDFDSIVQMRPNDPIALNNRCWVRALKNADLNLALDDCNKSLTIRPNNSFALGSRSFVDFRLKQFQLAIADSTASLAIDAQSADALYIRGLAKNELGDASGGADINSALVIRPTIEKEYGDYGVPMPRGH